jgi:hypothetical protein
MTTVKRHLIGSFLNTGTVGSPTWSLIGDGVSTGKIAFNPKVTEENYIHEASATTTIDGYAPNFPITQIAKNGDPVFEFIDELRKDRANLDSAVTELVNVWLYETPALGWYRAVKQDVSLQVDDFGGDGGQAARISYQINFNGDPVIGEFSPTELEFLPAPINTILTTMVIGSVTLTPLFATDKTWMHYAGTVENAVEEVSMTSTLSGATIVEYDGNEDEVSQAGNAPLAVGVNHLTIEVTVDDETVTYYIDITREAAE